MQHGSSLEQLFHEGLSCVTLCQLFIEEWSGVAFASLLSGCFPHVEQVCLQEESINIISQLSKTKEFLGHIQHYCVHSLLNTSSRDQC